MNMAFVRWIAATTAAGRQHDKEAVASHDSFDGLALAGTKGLVTEMSLENGFQIS